MSEGIDLSNSENENNLTTNMAPSALVVGVDAEVGTEEPRNNYSSSSADHYRYTDNNARTDIAHSDNSALSAVRQVPFMGDDTSNNRNHRAGLVGQGNFLSMAQSVRNLGFVPNMNMNFNHQHMNAFNASLNAASTINNVNFTRLRAPPFVPDVNASLSNANGFPNTYQPGFPPDFVPQLSQNHNPFALTEDNASMLQRGRERFYARESGLTQGPVGDGATMLSGHSSSGKGNSRVMKRGGGEDRGVPKLPISKRARKSGKVDDLTQQQPQQQPSLDASGQLANISGRSYLLYSDKDETSLSQYQCLARKQMEIFEATSADAGSNAQGRNRPILPGQIGIRCRHCWKLPAKERKTGSVYYPNRLLGVYQTAQKMTVGHLSKYCTMIPLDVRQRLLLLKDQKSSDGGGKRYWANGVRSFGIIETPNDGLKFA